jgi:ABC-type uncharacterized transport system permease subunit
MGNSYAPIATPSVDKSRWFRLIPIAMVVYIVSFMDRTNIGYAFAGIGRDFHVGKAAEGAAGGIFSLATSCFRYRAAGWPSTGARRSSSR